VGQTATLINGISGGTWSSSDDAVATMGSATGVASGISGGTATISYTSPTGCIATAPFSVYASAPITGASSVCMSQTTTLANGVSGGTCSSSNNTFATINSTSGLVTGIAGGVVTISYATGAGCVVTTGLTINGLSPVTGAGSVCVGQTATLTNGTSGGTWSSSNSGIVVLGSATGVATGVAAGIATVSYTTLTGCIATASFAVNALSAITGPGSVCVGEIITLANSSTGGTWASSNNTFAMVNSTNGVVTGVANGVATISYQVGGCLVTTGITINALASIAGGNSVCSGSVLNLSNSVGGGLWTSSNSGVASIGSATGQVTGIASGTTVISYLLSSGCLATATVAVNALGAISGPSRVCNGQSIALSNGTPGGTWTSGNTTIANIGSATGIVTGRTVGVTTISYTLGSCRATKTVNVSVLGTIGGILKTCVAQNTNLTNTGSGGLWSSSNTAIGTVVSGTGAVTGISAGTFIITYSIGSSCLSVATITVNALDAISGPRSVCVGQQSTLTNTTPAGGVWSSSNNTIANIGSATGIVTGVTGGSLNISFTVNGTGCRATYSMVVNALSVITGATSVCQGSTTTLTQVGLGTWSSSSTAVATIGTSTGVTTGVSAGTATISFVVNTTGCTATRTFTVHPADAITGSNSVCLSTPITLSNSVAGGTWSSTNPTIARVGSATGIVTGLIAGPGTTITYTTPRGCRSTKVVAVASCRTGSGIESEANLVGSEFILIPNPNKGDFSLKGTFASGVDEATNIEVVDMLGQVVYRSNEVALAGRLNIAIQLDKSLANGMYLLNVRSETESKVFHFVVSK
jgi:uncharacterized protein YjdB